MTWHGKHCMDPLRCGVCRAKVKMLWPKDGRLVCWGCLQPIKRARGE